ncbi:MAG: hypothetical protein WCA43_07470 [Bradyrhizobium sp.]
MRPFSFLVSVLVSQARQIVEALSPSWDLKNWDLKNWDFRNWDVRKYRPERHYMRGPGPKWREKHSSRPA